MKSPEMHMINYKDMEYEIKHVHLLTKISKDVFIRF